MASGWDGRRPVSGHGKMRRRSGPPYQRLTTTELLTRLNTMLSEPKLIKAGISGAPVTNWLLYDTIYTERYLGLPQENEKGYRESSPVHKAAKLEGKLMLVHNIGDDNVLFQNMLQMTDALQKAGKHFELQIYPQKSHGVGGPARYHLNEAMVDFFERQLGK